MYTHTHTHTHTHIDIYIHMYTLDNLSGQGHFAVCHIAPQGFAQAAERQIPLRVESSVKSQCPSKRSLLTL